MKANGGKWSHWPRPRAAIALDVHVFSGEKNSPRIDTACKWLLDEPGGRDAGEVIYGDDRQVKWLFARKSVRPSSMEEPKRGASPFDWMKLPSSPEADPVIYITAQTVANRVRDLRSAAQLRASWPIQPEPHYPFLHDEFEEQFRSEYLKELDPSNEWDRAELRSGMHEQRYERQAVLLKSLDLVTPRLLRDLAWDPLSMYGWMLPEMRNQPFAFELGKIPQESGETERFKAALRDRMRHRRDEHPGLFPLLVEVGITIVYFETDQGKDLDNLVRLVMPILMAELQPPSADQPYLWPYRDQPAPRAPRDDIAFIEAIALRKRPPGAVPGTAYLMLSSGWRHESWWEAAAHFLDQFDEDDEDYED